MKNPVRAPGGVLGMTSGPERAELPTIVHRSRVSLVCSPIHGATSSDLRTR